MALLAESVVRRRFPRGQNADPWHASRLRLAGAWRDEHSHGEDGQSSHPGDPHGFLLLSRQSGRWPSLGAQTLPRSGRGRQMASAKLGSRLVHDLRDSSRLGDPRCMAEPKVDGQRAQMHIAGRRTVAAYSRPGRSLIAHAGLA